MPVRHEGVSRIWCQCVDLELHAVAVGIVVIKACDAAAQPALPTRRETPSREPVTYHTRQVDCRGGEGVEMLI
jgi:hypothetical protein